jgi:hypothetical protein
MLQYLQGPSRPDILFAVSQISRYTFGPNRSHELALERIGRYLKGTINNGLILKPDLNESIYKIDVYVDAAFTSGWGTEQGTNPDSVKSRTGYIIEVIIIINSLIYYVIYIYIYIYIIYLAKFYVDFYSRLLRL